MKKLLIVLLFVAFIVGFYLADSTVAHEQPKSAQDIEIETLYERIAELEQELGNLKAEFEYHLKEGQDD
jgi:cell division protein FtsB